MGHLGKAYFLRRGIPDPFLQPGKNLFHGGGQAGVKISLPGQVRGTAKIKAKHQLQSRAQEGFELITLQGEIGQDLPE